MSATVKLACVFPGQGSQAVGMLDTLADVPEVAQLLSLADRVLGAPALSGMIAHGPAQDLALTTNTQPAMLVAALACYRAWVAAGGQTADVVAGHSLGEYTALVVAGVLADEQAIALTRVRADAMQSAVPVGEGAMAAILGLSDAQVQQACTDSCDEAAGLHVAPANFNAPAQVVIAGHAAAVEKACVQAKAMGAKRALPLAVSAPFHSRLLASAGERLAVALADMSLATPAIPLINNVDVAIENDPQRIRDALVRQASRPVRWVEVVQHMHAMGVTHMIEFGPGKVLTGLAGRIDKRIEAMSVHDADSLQAALARFS